jgi:hypothetical protein
MCEQKAFSIPDKRALKVDSVHGWGTPNPIKSKWYPTPGWRVWVTVALHITAVPGVPPTHCMRIADGAWDVGVNNDIGSGPLGPTSYYTVVTDASNGKLITAHPGFPLVTGYTYWDIVLGA